MDNGYYVSSTLYPSLAYCLNRYNFFITKFNETLFGGFAFSSINENLEHLGMLLKPKQGMTRSQVRILPDLTYRPPNSGAKKLPHS